MRLLISCISLAACAGSQAAAPHGRNTDVAQPPGATEPAMYSCGDTVLGDQVTSGGLRVAAWQPCWDLDEEFGAQYARRDVTRHDRDVDARLAEVEATACADVLPHERAHSPFSHKKAINTVIPHRVGGQLAGVRVIFKPVPGLTKQWLERDLVCQKARWEALGKLPSSDPTLVDGAQVSVIDRGPYLEVLVETDTPDQAEIALARAQGQTEPVPGSQSATR